MMNGKNWRENAASEHLHQALPLSLTSGILEVVGENVGFSSRKYPHRVRLTSMIYKTKTHFQVFGLIIVKTARFLYVLLEY